MRLVNKIVLATLNRGKFDEFKKLLSSYPNLELVGVEELVRNAEGISHAERHNTYLENATAKARLVNHACHYPALADDSGLEVFSLQGKPGVRSHRYATPRRGISQDQANIDLLLSELKGSIKRKARFVCTLALVMEGLHIQSTGVLEGTIAEAPRGQNGFGYDSVFIPEGDTRTLAEMNEGEKNALSHRCKAVHELMAQTKNFGITFAKP